MEFFRQEYCSGLPFRFLGDLPDPEMEPASLASPALTGGFFTTEPSKRDLKRSHQKEKNCTVGNDECLLDLNVII